MKVKTKARVKKVPNLQEAAQAIAAESGNEFLVALAVKPFAGWTPKMKFAIHRTLKKHKELLEEAGIDYDKLEVPEKPERFKVLDFDGKAKEFILRFSYSWSVLQNLRTAIERSEMRFDKVSKEWRVPMTLKKQVKVFAKDNDFEVMPKAVKPLG